MFIDFLKNNINEEGILLKNYETTRFLGFITYYDNIDLGEKTKIKCEINEEVKTAEITINGKVKTIRYVPHTNFVISKKFIGNFFKIFI